MIVVAKATRPTKSFSVLQRETGIPLAQLYQCVYSPHHPLLSVPRLTFFVLRCLFISLTFLLRVTLFPLRSSLSLFFFPPFQSHFFRIAAHLIYWGKAKVIDIMTKLNIYALNPTSQDEEFYLPLITKVLPCSIPHSSHPYRSFFWSFFSSVYLMVPGI